MENKVSLSVTIAPELIHASNLVMNFIARGFVSQTLNGKISDNKQTLQLV